MHGLFIACFSLFAGQNKPRKTLHLDPSEDAQDEANVAKYPTSYLGAQKTMGSNISQHSNKGLKGRRARSSGDLCNGETKSQTDSTVCGSVVGDVMGWNRSLPNHLDGNRHLADYSRVNNNYAEFGTYKKRNQKGGRGLRYRVFKTGKIYTIFTLSVISCVWLGTLPLISPEEVLFL